MSFVHDADFIFEKQTEKRTMTSSQLNFKYKSLVLALALLPVSVLADSVTTTSAPDSVRTGGITAPSSEDAPMKVVEPSEKQIRKENLPGSLPSEKNDEPKVVLTREYLLQHPRELEQMMAVLIRTGDARALKMLIPIYHEVPDKDMSLMEWGVAIINMNDGNYGEAVSLYRKLIASFPDVKTLRFQLAIALFRDGQYEASKDQFEKLRSEETLGEGDIKVIEQYLTAINSRNKWSFNGSLSYLNDNNINGVPPKGTQIVYDNGSSLSSSTEPKKGQGFSYSFSADKKWALTDRIFTAFEGSADGSYYWNAKPYNDLTARVGQSIGYQTPRSEISFMPFFQKRWYGGGSRGGNSMKSYVNTPGFRVDASRWLTPRLRYQGAFEYGKDSYADTYDYMDGESYLLSNSIVLYPNQKQFWYLGWDMSKKNAEDKSNAYFRNGMRVGWGQEWPKGISTRLNLGYGKRRYKAEDVFGIQQVANEYSANLSLWHRNIHFWGITPRLVYSYRKVDGNQPFYNYDTHKVFLNFTKTF